MPGAFRFASACETFCLTGMSANVMIRLGFTGENPFIVGHARHNLAVFNRLPCNSRRGLLCNVCVPILLLFRTVCRNVSRLATDVTLSLFAWDDWLATIACYVPGLSTVDAPYISSIPGRRVRPRTGWLPSPLPSSCLSPPRVDGQDHLVFLVLVHALEEESREISFHNLISPIV